MKTITYRYKIDTLKNELGEVRYQAWFVTPWYIKNKPVDWDIYNDILGRWTYQYRTKTKEEILAKIDEDVANRKRKIENKIENKKAQFKVIISETHEVKIEV